MEEFFIKNKQQIIECTVMSFTPLACILSAKCGLKTWLKFEQISVVLGALVLIFCPKTFFRHVMKGELDLYHYNLLAILGALAISSVLYTIMLMDSKDENIFTEHLWSRIISSAMRVMIIFHTYKFEKEWNYRILCTFGSANIALFITSCYLYVKNFKTRAHSTFNDTINYFAKLEALKHLLYGLLFFALPELVVLSKGGNTHKMLCRVIGTIMFSIGIQAHGVSDFMYLNDKKKFILSRLIGGFITLQALLVGFYYYNEVPIARVAMVVGGYVIYSSVLLIGYRSAKVKEE